jgi:hypothetical protein
MRLTRNLEPISEALKKLADEAAAAQETLYAPLRKAFDAGWKNGDMGAFFDLCAQHAKEGKLVAGWNEADHRDVNLYGSAKKIYKAMEAARQYDARVQAAAGPLKTFTEWLKTPPREKP